MHLNWLSVVLSILLKVQNDSSLSKFYISCKNNLRQYDDPRKMLSTTFTEKFINNNCSYHCCSRDSVLVFFTLLLNGRSHPNELICCHSNGHVRLPVKWTHTIWWCWARLSKPRSILKSTIFTRSREVRLWQIYIDAYLTWLNIKLLRRT